MIKIARYRNIPYTVNYKTENGIRPYLWSGSKSNFIDKKDIPEEVVNWLLSSTSCFSEGELVIVDETEETTEMLEMIDDIDAYKNNTHTKDEIVSILEGTAANMKTELSGITIQGEKKFIVEIAKELKIDSSAKLKWISEWSGVPIEVFQT